jgi:hypothetical protein
MNFTGAGCLFFNEQFLLAGYQPRKQRPVLSGLGGKKEGDEDVFTTGLRETLEELFELFYVPPGWIEQIQCSVPHKGLLKNGDYVSILYSFDDLQKILEILKTLSCKSDLYDDFPTNLLALVFNRKQMDKPPEVSHLTFVPLVFHTTETPFVSPEFLKDMRLLLQSGILVQPRGSVDS